MRARMVFLQLFLMMSLIPVVQAMDGGHRLWTNPFKPVYKAEIRRTEGGIPHIKARDFAGLGFGTGYAAASDNICLLAKNVLKHRGELSRYFGPGENNENLNSDFFYKLMIRRGMADQPIHPEFEALFRGYAAGYNHYLRNTEGLSDPNCSSAGWVEEISVDDVRRINTMPYFLPNFADMIVAAIPPGAPIANARIKTSAFLTSVTGKAGDRRFLAEDIRNPFNRGSNGIALGQDATRNGKGMLYANPHMTWEDSARFIPMHQTIPGVMDMVGATAFDRANVGFGVTEHVAWTNTVSKAQRFSFYALILGETPTTYMFDGEPMEMTAETVSVTVANPDGAFEERTHTFYSTHFGFVVGGDFPWLHGIEGVPDMAFALRLAGEGVRSLNGGISGSIQAKSVRELKAAQDAAQYSIVNLIAADSSGEVLYGDPGPAVNLTGLPDYCFQGSVMVGSTSVCQWRDHPDAADRGILPPDQLPSLFRTDYVLNSNDSYWLANPNAPLTGYSPVMGEVGTERTLRTRSGLQMVEAQLADGRFSLKKLMKLGLRNENYAGQLLRDDLVTLIANNPDVEVEGVSVNISEAGDVLAVWDLHSNLKSRGSHLFREFLREANKGNDNTRILPADLNYTTPFDPQAPLTTPSGLDTEENPEALQAMARAVLRLRSAGIPLDARLGDIQTVTRNDRTIPIHGGTEMEGVFNKVWAGPDFDPWDGVVGYREITGPSASWLLAAKFTGNGPKIKGVLAYSLSANPESPHHADMTEMFSRKRWVDIPFNDEDVEEAALDKVVIREGAGNCFGRGWTRFSQPAFKGKLACIRYFNSLKGKGVTEFTNGENK